MKVSQNLCHQGTKDTKGWVPIFASLVPVAISLATPVFAQESWPTRPVRMIVSSAPAGGTDVYARLVANAYTEAFKQQFIVENRPGGNGTIAADAVAKSVPDGHTLLVSASPSIVLAPVLFKKQPYDVDRDLAPVTRGVLSPLALVVLPSQPIKTLTALIAAAKREELKVPYGSAGAASMTHLGVRLFEEAAGIRFLHIPYKGVGPAIQDLLGGQVTFVLTDLPAAINHIRSGKLLPLAVMPKTALLPSTQSFAEAGFPGAEVSAAFAIVAPAGTPAAVMQRLSTELMKAMKSAPLAGRLDELGLIPVFDTPEEAAARLRKEREMWAAFVKRTGMTVDQ
jgi:tripartite-type tricarboxylate transporter receptor subunit TctC